MLQLSAWRLGMPWGGQRVCHCRAGGPALLTMALLSQPGWKEWRNILGAAACHAGMEQGMGSRMRSNRMRGSKDPEPLRNPVVLQLEPLHLRQLH